MGRKNYRSRETYIPVDLTPPPTLNPDRGNSGPTGYRAREAAREREAEQAERQRQARISRGIDWSLCVIPGCGNHLSSFRFESLPDSRRRDPNMELPLCSQHAGVLWRQLARLRADDPKFIEAIADVNARVAEREQRLHREDAADRMANLEHGDIYFVRLGALVKVGWTRDLAQRLKSYGASAELLVSYPASRDDETNLHRQLTPARAKGREWYEDGAIIAKFIDEALAKYGMPTLSVDWTTPKRIVAGKRHR